MIRYLILLKSVDVGWIWTNINCCITVRVNRVLWICGCSFLLAKMMSEQQNSVEICGFYEIHYALYWKFRGFTHQFVFLKDLKNTLGKILYMYRVSLDWYLLVSKIVIFSCLCLTCPRWARGLTLCFLVVCHLTATEHNISGMPWGTWAQIRSDHCVSCNMVDW